MKAPSHPCRPIIHFTVAGGVAWTLCLAVILSLAVRVETACGGTSRSPDQTDLSAAFNARFEKEVWPLMIRRDRDGCVGCHNARHRSTLKFSGEAARDFQMLLREGFFLVDDPGGLLHVVTTSNPDTHMPPGKRPSWTAEEIGTLRRFVEELSQINKSQTADSKGSP